MAQQKARKQKPVKIKKYRKPLNLNIGMVIFGAVFVYVVICVVMYFRTEHIVRYEVREGSLAETNLFRGIALRDETLVSTDTAGFINYYAREGERVAKGDLVYTVDETGKLKQYMETINMGENSLSDKELAQFRDEIVDFMHGFDPRNFESTYDLKYSIKGTVLKLANASMLQDLNSADNADAGLVNLCKSQQSGIVSYWTDGYEGLTPDKVTAEIMDEKEYEKKQLVTTDILAVGDPVYKLSTNEKWTVIIPVDAERGAALEEEGYVKVRFLKNQYEAWGAVKLLHNGDGNTYIQLSFTNSMVSFVSDRFLDVELIVNDQTGLKIPNSSIVNRDFYLIPEAYLTKGGDSSNDGVIRQRFLEDGTLSSEFVETNVYSFDEEAKEYYLDTSVLNMGDVLIAPDSQETYTVSRMATLIGVYNMNKGYADFKEINILNQNEEYAIVQSNNQYGLRAYDYIVLNADVVTEDQFVYQ